MNGTTGIVWDWGFTVGLWVAGIFVVLCIAAIIADLAWDFDGAGVVVGAIGLVLTLAITGFATWPWEAQYHQWRPVSGVVQQVSSRMIADGKAMSQRFVLVIDGQPYGVDDTRASLVKVGDTVSLMCTKEWVWASTPGDACRWVS